MNEITRTTNDYRPGVVLWSDTLTTGQQFLVVSTGPRTGDVKIININHETNYQKMPGIKK